MNRLDQHGIAAPITGAVLAIAVDTGLWSAATSAATLATDPDHVGPFAVAQRTIVTTNPDTGNQIQTVLYYPANGDEVDPAGAPYAALVFAHGFMATTSSYPGDGEHLASWGYIVAMPNFPNENTAVRASDAQHVLDYLEAENTEPSSLFYGKIDAGRLGIAGHSLGGLTTVMVSARDTRIRAAVALDPVNPPDFVAMEWDYETEAPQITAPVLVIGAPAQYCNSFANYNDMYPLIGSEHKAKIVLTNGSHCDFMLTDNQAFYTACYWMCGGSYNANRVRLPVGYMTAWFNYYLRSQTEYYTYLYGAEAQADVQAGLVASVAHTAPRNVTAESLSNGIRLGWDLSSYEVVAGYNVYRSTVSGDYPGAPYAEVGRQAYYTDSATALGNRYYYLVKSRDAAGNEHASSSEVSAVAGQLSTPTSTPTPTITPTLTRTLTPTRTPDITFTPTAVSPTVEAERWIYLPLNHK